MTTVQFRSQQCNDLEPMLDLEEIFRLYGSWSGIHDFDFNVLFEDDTLTMTGITADRWTYFISATLLPTSFVVTYHKTAARQGLVIQGSSGSVFLIIGSTSTGIEIRNSATNVVHSIPLDLPVEADVTIVFRQTVLDDANTQFFRTVTVYMNDAWVTNYGEIRPNAVDDLQIGFAAFDTDSVTYTNIRIPELCNTAEFGTLDPGETALGGMQRTIEGYYLKYFVRWNGSLRAWRKKDRDSVFTFVDSTFDSSKRSTGLASLITHARMMGAYIWGEAVNTDFIRAYGHRFAEVNNSMLLTEQECITEASNELKRSEEAVFTIGFQAQQVAWLEPEDRVATYDGDWVISEYSFQATGDSLMTSYGARRYVWEMA